MSNSYSRRNWQYNVGLVGYGGLVSNSYSTGSVTGNESVGGLVGKMVAEACQQLLLEYRNQRASYFGWWDGQDYGGNEGHRHLLRGGLEYNRGRRS